MRTTIRLDDALLAEAKLAAAERGTTLTALIEDSLRESLARRQRPTRRVELPTSRGGGWVQPGVDLDDSAALLELMESGDDPV
jgi:Arc/MetJ family transcription regulator